MTFITSKLKDLNENRQQNSISSDNHSETFNSSSPLVTRFRFEVNEVIQHIRSKIWGQDEVLEGIEEMLNIIWTDITEENRPLYVALFLGPTGVGKTEIVRVLSEAIYGNAEAFCRIDMNTLTQEHYAAALTGAPPGYVGSKEGNSLFQKEKIEGSYSKPGIVLFDELEKANDQVIYSLLNVMDNGILVMTSGEKVIHFRNAMIFMTSNIGAKEIISYANKSLKYRLRKLLWFLSPSNFGKTEQDFLRSIVFSQLEKRFSPEFINRFDDIFVFQWLKQDALEHILDLNIQAINRRIKKYNCTLQLDESARKFLIKKGFDQRYGARFLKRAIRKYIEVPLAAKISKRLHQDHPTKFIAKIKDGNLFLFETAQEK
ncbi:AAA family ATPase [Aeribacillus composti]|uniref:AAA family ATPase n=1 Tax=Aeribacillus composti TaxID=1868734 RepID=UPI002E22ED8B|nr:AAA family ATPase [Aeribacillus composti]